MIENRKMRVLVVSKSSWVDSNALGNTLSNFFADWENTEFYNIYCREELPQNKVCFGYFNITEKQIIKSFFRRGKAGREFAASDLTKMVKSEHYESDSKNEKKMIDRFRNRMSFAILREIIWRIGNRHNSKLDNFLERVNPDIIFSFAADPGYLQRLIIKCKTKTSAKLILFFADDTYSHKTKRPLEFLYKVSIRNAIRKSVKGAAKIYGISQMLCDEYEQHFDKKIKLLRKGCELDQHLVKQEVSTPIKIVYAGNLYYGRKEILEALANEIEKNNSDAIKIALEIFTTATVTPDIDKALNRGQSSRIMGGRPYEEIKDILAQADIVLHVESFDPKQTKVTRLSFSTKIIDGMQSGSCMMAIGPECLASIDYLKNAEGAIVITDLTKIGEVLHGIVEDPGMIVKNAGLLRIFAAENHDIQKVRYKLKSELEGLSILDDSKYIYDCT